MNKADKFFRRYQLMAAWRSLAQLPLLFRVADFGTWVSDGIGEPVPHFSGIRLVLLQKSHGSVFFFGLRAALQSRSVRPVTASMCFRNESLQSGLPVYVCFRMSRVSVGSVRKSDRQSETSASRDELLVSGSAFLIPTSH